MLQQSELLYLCEASPTRLGKLKGGNCIFSLFWVMKYVWGGGGKKRRKRKERKENMKNSVLKEDYIDITKKTNLKNSHRWQWHLLVIG